MGKLPVLDTVPIEPVYYQDEPNQPIRLGNVDIEFTHEGATYRAIGAAIMEFQRKRLQVIVPTEEFPLPLNGIALFLSDGVELKLTANNTTVAVHCRVTGRDRDRVVFSPERSPIAISANSLTITTARFHLFNFPDFFGPQDYILKSTSSAMRCGRIKLGANN
jgi:hypothetical protein